MFQHNIDIYKKKWQGFGWNTLDIDGHSIGAILNALDKARKQTKKPTVIIAKTFKGKGLTEAIEDKLDWHGKDLGAKT